MKTHLILGGSGFIGRHVALRLVQAGHRVIVAARKPPPASNALRNITFMPFKLEAANWDDLVAACDVVHHYAWTTIPEGAEKNAAGDLHNNVGSTIGLLEALARAGGKRLIFASSGGTVYGYPRAIPITEDHPLTPVSAHGASKAAAEHYITLFQNRGVDVRIARLSNVYGAGQDPAAGLGAVVIFLTRALNNEEITIWGDGSAVRDYIHVADASEALVRLSVAHLGAVNFALINIGSGEGRSLNQVVASIRELLQHELRVRHLQNRRFDIPVNVLDTSLAARMLDWRPELSFETGVARLYADLIAGRSQYSSLG